MGRGSGAIPQAQTSVVAAIDLAFDYSHSTSEQVIPCEWKEKENQMNNTITNTIKSDAKSICIKVKFEQIIICLSMAALLMFGYGDGFSPSAIALLYNEDN